MFQFQNPTNDFYFRNAQMQQPNYGQQFLPFPAPQQQPQVQQMPQINCRFVTNIDEAKAAMIDPLSMNIFLDSGTGRIYLKRLTNNGQSEFLCYSVEAAKETKQTDPMEEIKGRLSNIEKYLGEMRNDKSVPSVSQSAAGSEQPVAGTNAANDGAEPTGFQKNAGNGKWQKR